MARRLDRIVMWLLILSSLFCAFMSALGENMALSACLAAAACLALRALLRRLSARFRGRSRRARRRYAKALLGEWLLLPEHETREKLRALFASSGRPMQGKLIILPFAPDSTALNGDLALALWRAHKGERQITVAAFCRAEESARQWARRLGRPAMSIADGETLEAMLMKVCRVAPASFSQPDEKRVRLPDALRRLIRRVNPVKAGCYAAAALALYLISGRLIYLAAFGAFLAMASLSVYRRRAAG